MFPRHSDRLWLRSRSIPEDAVGNTPKVRRVSERRSAPSASRSAPGAAASSGWVRYAAGFGVLAALGLLGGFAPRDVPSNPQGPADAPAGTESFAIGDVAHTPDSVEYEQDPPAGGGGAAPRPPRAPPRQP